MKFPLSLHTAGITLALVVLFISPGCGGDSPSTPEDPPPPPVKRSFPVSVGTQWTFTHVYHSGPHWAWGGTMYDESGIRTWLIISSVIADGSVVCTIQATPCDTARWKEYSYGVLVRDSTYINTTPSRFDMVVTPDNIQVGWTGTIGWIGPMTRSLSRPPQEAGDTLKIDEYPVSSTYVWGVGLVKYFGAHSNQMTDWHEWLILTSFSTN